MMTSILQHVMRFAELTQEVVIDRAIVDTAEHKEGLVPGRRLANLASRGMAETDGPVVHPYKLALPPFNIEEVNKFAAALKMMLVLFDTVLVTGGYWRAESNIGDT